MDEIVKTKLWEFDDEVTSVFDNMLERSIPEYDTMRELVRRIGFRYVKIGTTIMDVGCSNGNAIAPFVSQFGDDCNYIMLDTSKPMLKKCRERFGSLDIREYDITKGVPKENTSVILSILTLQFTPIEYRHKIVQSIYDTLCVGGAFIMVEKVLGNTAGLDEMFVSEYYKLKEQNKYTQEQIQSKRKSLEGVLVPIAAKWNEDLLKESGFNQIDCFWRCLNFAGWVAIK